MGEDDPFEKGVDESWGWLSASIYYFKVSVTLVDTLLDELKP
jgi:hypothetical protein